jgi:hypothetical protein
MFSLLFMLTGCGAYNQGVINECPFHGCNVKFDNIEYVSNASGKDLYLIQYTYTKGDCIRRVVNTCPKCGRVLTIEPIHIGDTTNYLCKPFYTKDI